MGGHNNECIDTKTFMMMAIVEAVGYDEAGFFAYKNRQPLNNGKS